MSQKHAGYCSMGVLRMCMDQWFTEGALGGPPLFAILPLFSTAGTSCCVVHTKIKESGRGLLAGLEEVFAVRTMGTQFTPDRIPLDIHPSNEKISLNDSVGLHVARKRKIWQRDASLPTRDTIIKRDSGDTQMDVDDALRLPLRHEQILK